MITALGILVALGVALGIWQQVQEQRRIGRMAKDFNAGRKA